jgi:hypothetical protein
MQKHRFDVTATRGGNSKTSDDGLQKSKRHMPCDLTDTGVHVI